MPLSYPEYQSTTSNTAEWPASATATPFEGRRFVRGLYVKPPTLSMFLMALATDPDGRGEKSCASRKSYQNIQLLSIIEVFRLTIDPNVKISHIESNTKAVALVTLRQFGCVVPAMSSK